MLMLSICMSAQTQRSDSYVPFSQNREKDIFLDGMWKFHLYKDAAPEGFHLQDYDDSQWSEIEVPGCWDALGLVRPRYVSPEKVEGIYRTSFDVPSSWKDEHVFIRFDGVLRGYEFWINGQYAGRWESAYNSCQFDITGLVRTGENLLAVRVYTEYKGTGFDSNDDWGQVGINRSVSIFPVSNLHLADLSVTTAELTEDSATVKVDALLDAFEKNSSKRENVEILIHDPNGAEIYSWKDRCSHDSIAINKSIHISRPYLWTAETPFLYTLSVKTGKKSREIVRFGIREVKVVKEKLLINGRPVKLRGVNHHDTDPFAGKVISRESLLHDMKMMKEANINFIRCSHYPKSPEFYSLCDSLGFYVMDEVPFGFGEEHLNDPAYLETLVDRAHATVIRDRNHPSVIIWSIGNENHLTDIAKKTGIFVKELDPTRPICYPMIHNYFLSLDFNLPDFVDIYAPHYPTVHTLRYYAAAADRPVILTEYCHTLGQSLEQHDELWEIIEENDNLAGGAIWEWSDQGMVDNNAEFPGRFRYSQDLWLKDSTRIVMAGDAGTDGLVYAERTPLSNYYEVRKNYAQAKILTSSLTGIRGMNRLTLEIANRYDFIDLKDAVRIGWSLYDGRTFLTGGEIVPACPPGNTARETVEVTLHDDPAQRCYIMKVNVTDSEGLSLGDYSIPVLSQDGKIARSILSMGEGETEKASEETRELFPEYVDSDIMLRVGRKRGLAERIRAKDAVKHYLIKPEWGSSTTDDAAFSQDVTYRNSEFSAKGQIRYEVLAGGAIRISASVKPEGGNVLLLEGGAALKLTKGLDRFQWLGQGPFASYPGKSAANSFGCHSAGTGDLYFEGNRMGTDAILCSDSNGKGILFICEGCSVNLEETDQGVIVTFNDIVSGLCGKLRKTAFPIYSEDVEEISVSVTMIPFDCNSCPEETASYFEDPSRIVAENPFITQYDTFVLPLEEILGN